MNLSYNPQHTNKCLFCPFRTEPGGRRGLRIVWASSRATALTPTGIGTSTGWVKIRQQLAIPLSVPTTWFWNSKSKVGFKKLIKGLDFQREDHRATPARRRTRAPTPSLSQKSRTSPTFTHPYLRATIFTSLSTALRNFSCIHGATPASTLPWKPHG